MSKIKDYFGIIIFLILTAVFLGLLAGLIAMHTPAQEKETIIGAVFIDDIDDEGWNENHYTGLKEACDSYGLKLNIVTNVAETLEDTEAAVKKLVEQGCNVIFLTSGGFGKSVYPVMEKYKDVQFYTISADSEPSNANTYFGRFYQIRFLSGMIAGKMTKTNVLGFVGAINDSQVNRGINAFILGARSVNPDVVLKVRFLDGWTDPEGEKEAAEKLIEEDNADVIAYHASLHTAIDAAEEHQVYSIGYNNYKNDYSDKYLLSIVCEWNTLYGMILGDFLKGDIYDSKYYWRGVVIDSVQMINVSETVPKDLLEMVEERKQKLVEGVDVFYGNLVTNDGRIVCTPGERISDDALLRRMDWFLEGVEIYE